MITGMVKADEGRICLKVKGPHGREQEIEAVIDTGYTASLTLPRALVAALGLRWRSVDRGTLADGSECLFDVYEAKVMWDGKVCDILASYQRACSEGRLAEARELAKKALAIDPACFSQNLPKKNSR